MTVPDKDLTYKAQWLKMEYTLQFKTGEGTSVSPIKGNYGDKISVPKDPTRTGYIFKYWSENGKKVDKLPADYAGRKSYLHSNMGAGDIPDYL